MELRTSESSLLIYGRRKTGKTWLARNCIDYDKYMLITRDGTCLIGEEVKEEDLSKCIESAINTLSNKGSVVVDEFQRIPKSSYIEALAQKSSIAEGRIVLLGSSFRIVDEVFSAHSPLLGLVEAYHADIADPRDTILSLVKCGLKASDAVKWMGLARDPWILGLINPRGDPVDVIHSHASRLAPIAPGLIGEIFAEEGRSLSRIYDAILRLLAKGYWNTSQLTQKLYNAGLLERPSQSMITGYMKNLVDMGLVKGIRLWRTRGSRVYYRHRSSLLAILYYILDQVDELGGKPSKDALRSRYYFELQFDIGEMLAKSKNLRLAYSITPEGWDVDILLVDKKGNPLWGYEVKKGTISKRDAYKAAERLKSIGIPRVGIISLEEEIPRIRGVDEVLGPNDFLNLEPA
jgi:hypothetical protein